MAIQFFCVACRQPIEVDDEMANLTVTCPYCRKVVTAPAVTEGVMLENPPVASPSGTGGLPGTMPYAPTRPSGTNIWSWISLGCVSFSLIVLAVLLGLFASLAKGLGANPTPQEMSKFFAEEISKRPGIQALGMAGICFTPILGLVAGIVALVRRTPPRWPAVIALAVSGLFILLLCLNLVFSAMAMGGKQGG
ncbi:MAG TPA: hypothetical protein VJZ71_05320 [Phycisphaerae bacterium]|nr:hypothetical protein [Phycisphaerae bacterium]